MEQGSPLVQIYNSMYNQDGETELISSQESLLNATVPEKIDATLGIYCIFCYVIYIVVLANIFYKLSYR